MTHLAAACAIAGAVVWHRLGREWRHFITELAIEVALGPDRPATPRRHS